MEVLKNNSHRAVNVPLLILLAISIAVGAGIYFFQKSVNKDIEQTASSLNIDHFKQVALAINNTDSWKTFRSEILGIEFQYPPELGEPQIEYKDYTDGTKKDFSGKAIEAYFIYPDSNLAFAFGAHSPDYRDPNFNGFVGSNDIFQNCKEELTYDNEGNACKIISIPSNKAVMENDLWQVDGHIGFGTKVYFNSFKNLEFKGLEFYTLPADANSAIQSLWSSPAVNKNAINQEALNRSRNIMAGDNLSAGDKKSLDTFLKIISTFKYID